MRTGRSPQNTLVANLRILLLLLLLLLLHTVDAPGNDGNASMSEQVKLPNPWRKIIIIIIIIIIITENIQIKLARHVAAMNNNWMPKIILNYRSNG
jgi:hypothetical protein